MCTISNGQTSCDGDNFLCAGPSTGGTNVTVTGSAIGYAESEVIISPPSNISSNIPSTNTWGCNLSTAYTVRFTGDALVLGPTYFTATNNVKVCSDSNGDDCSNGNQPSGFAACNLTALNDQCTIYIRIFSNSGNPLLL